VVLTHGLRLVLTRAAVTAVSTVTSTAWRAVATFTAVAAGFALTLFGSFAAGLVLAAVRVVGALVSVNRGRMVVRVDGSGGLQVGFFAFAEAQHLFQAGFDAAEERGFFRGVVGASRRGHKR